MSEPAGVYEAMQLAEASARGPFWKELQEALVRCSSLTASLEASGRREQRYREALAALLEAADEVAFAAGEDVDDHYLWTHPAAGAARALLVEHDPPSETTTDADASNTVAIVVQHKDNGRTITYEVSRERIRTEHNEEEAP